MIVKSDNRELERAVMKASLKLIQSNDIFGYVLMRIPVLISNKYDKPYDIFSNGKMIVFNTNRIIQLKELMSNVPTDKLLKHELSHILLNHLERQKRARAKLSEIPEVFFTIAQEYIVNRDIGMSAYGLVDKKWLIDTFMLKTDDDEWIKINQMSFEQLAGYLYYTGMSNGSVQEITLNISISGTQGDNEGNGNGNSQNESSQRNSENKEIKINAMKDDGQGGFKDINTHMVGDVQNKEVDKQIKDEMEEQGMDKYEDFLNDVIRKALIKSHGMERTGLWRELENMVFSHTINWRKVLQDYVKSYKSQEDAEEGLKYVNRRFYTLKGYNPKMPIFFNKKKQIYDRTIIAIDTSGSITDDEYKKQVSEVLNFLRDEKVRGEIVLFTAGVEKGIPFTDKTNIIELMKSLKTRTDGGTDFEPVFEYAFRYRAKLLIFFSDLYANYPKRTDWGYKVLLMTSITDYEEQADKFGRVIIMEDKKTIKK
ncbi:MAG: VWA-like domain-containing protein [Gammaproteobacteria bacterium]